MNTSFLLRLWKVGRWMIVVFFALLFGVFVIGGEVLFFSPKNNQAAWIEFVIAVIVMFISGAVARFFQVYPMKPSWKCNVCKYIWAAKLVDGSFPILKMVSTENKDMLCRFCMRVSSTYYSGKASAEWEHI